MAILLNRHTLSISRQQLAEVIQKHSKALSEKQQEIIRASEEETSEEIVDSSSFRVSSEVKKENEKPKVEYSQKGFVRLVY